MPYRTVTKPILFPRAFGATSDAAILSQAAILLLLEPALRRDRARLAEHRSARRTLKVPAISATGRRVKVEEVESPLRLRPLSSARQALPATRFRRLATDFGKKPNLLAVASLMEACLRHPHPLVRAAAAISYFGLTSEPSRLIGILEDCTHSDDELVRTVAATGLARLAPESPHLSQLTKPPTRRRRGSSTHTSLLVHGTWAANEQWWKPGGNFHSYLLNGIRPDLYANADAFSWSGAYSEAARAIAATELQAWLAGHAIQNPYLLTHSHGRWTKFMDWVQDPELASDPSLVEEKNQHKRRDFIMDRLDKWAKRFTKTELVEEAQRRHFPASPVSTPLDLIDDPQLIARGFLKEIAHPEFGRIKFPEGAIASVLGTQLIPAPRLGEHNAEILAQLGYSETDCESLISAGAVQ